MALRSQQPGIEPRGGHGYGLGVVEAEVAHGAPRLKPVSGACGGDAYSSMVCCLAHSGCAKAVQKMVNAAPMIHTGKCAKANNVCTGAQASCQLLPQWNSWEDGQWARSCGRLGDAGVVHTHTHTHGLRSARFAYAVDMQHVMAHARDSLHFALLACCSLQS